MAVTAHGGITRLQHSGSRGIIASQVAQQLDRDPAVGDRRGGPGQAGQECPQPCRCLPC